MTEIEPMTDTPAVPSGSVPSAAVPSASIDADGPIDAVVSGDHAASVEGAEIVEPAPPAMTEEAAREATRAIVGDAAIARLERFADYVRAESENQNLVSKPSLGQMWLRHLLDSAQLIPKAASAEGLWVDIGSGAGFPGMVIALATDRPVALVEPRRMRAEFLQRIVDAEGLGDRVQVIQSKADRMPALLASVISARAVGALNQLLDGTAHIANRATLYLLPKGQSATTELDGARRRFEGMFHVEQSITDQRSGIIVATKVRRR